MHSPNEDPNFIENSQTRHRTNLINTWQIPPGSKVLEIGCGQGDTTAVLAMAVGPQGHVDALDPAPLSYGSPCTLGEAQANLSNSDIGDRITWHQVSPVDFLKDVRDDEEGKEAYDIAVLAHCIWYFPSQNVLKGILAALRGKAKRICIAEYALSASHPAAMPHVLTALARATLEAHKTKSQANIQTVLSPTGISRIAEEAGWKLVSETMITPDEDLDDGRWETGNVTNEKFLRKIDKAAAEERVRVLIQAMRDAVIAAVKGLGDERVRTMDVWIAEFQDCT
ncbi:S-adenosyl-L-methionine-dependent methyltransferase [Lepidopterella palustris CBS 459.81]|uniref:S-adenosyl-L-methionine-dependent methyltransferase n=1 Tax=Lepidopterella palustris CBS 459.81 TaxID=1314670 RepID=A0A8E2EJL0_9PEZI|nr:S-adenosyl-L-methionine-dependent methyltransferase [Lepidopterella palustris CBS 459.81]